MPTSKKNPGGRRCCAHGVNDAGQHAASTAGQHAASTAGQNAASTAAQHEPEGESESRPYRVLLRELDAAMREVLPADVGALSTGEAAALYTVLDGYMASLWHEHRQTLYPLFLETFGQLVAAEVNEKDEPEEPVH